jgi:hypothetical protein
VTETLGGEAALARLIDRQGRNFAWMLATI